MYTINFSILLDGEMYNNSYRYYCFQTALVTVHDIINDYALIPAKDGDCWSITVFYKETVILTINSNMF